MSNQGYQGWSNHTTWLVNLWLNNNYDVYKECLELVKDCKEGVAQDRLEEYVSDMVGGSSGLAGSIISSAVHREVNWKEIARSFLDME